VTSRQALLILLVIEFAGLWQFAETRPAAVTKPAQEKHAENVAVMAVPVVEVPVTVPPAQVTTGSITGRVTFLGTAPKLTPIFAGEIPTSRT